MSLQEISRKAFTPGLAMTTGLVAAFFLLPWLSTIPLIQTRVDFNRKHGINGGATFYTDQDFLMEQLERKDRSQSRKSLEQSNLKQ